MSSRKAASIPHLGKRVEDDKTVERLATEFAAKVQKLEFSRAEGLSFLLAISNRLNRQLVT
jgi:hypothetical protein